MSLSKQLISLITIIFMAIFAINFYMSINNIRNYLQTESEIHAQDTATSLGLSLSPYILDKDDTILETMVNTIFDRGYYLEIKLLDMDGNELVRKTNPKTFTSVPDWFVSLLPMRTVSAGSDIDAGWMIGGRVEVTIHPGLGYLRLWEQAQRTSSASAMLFALAFLVLLLVVKLLLKPLQRIQTLALQIAEGKYERISPLPWTTEIRAVAQSMNLMSGKIEKVISSLNERLDETSKRLHTDTLTGLSTRVTFETSMKERFMTNKRGHLFVIRLDNLAEFAKRTTSERVDGFIRDFSELTLKIAEKTGHGGDRLYRIVGSEFILVSDQRDKAAAETLLKGLAEAYETLGQQYQRDSVAHIGAVAYDATSTTASLISAATEAYEKANLIGNNGFAFSDGAANARSMDEWHQLVDAAINDDQFEVDYAMQAYSLTEGEEQQLVIEEALSRVVDANGETVPIGTFIAIAESSQRISDFDFKVVQAVVDHIKQQAIEHQVAVNLSMSSLRDNSFRSAVFKLLEREPQAAKQLTFSVTAYAATQDLEVFSSFINFAHRTGTRVMLKRFESRLIEMDKLGSYNLDFIRLARHYTEDLSQNPEKRLMVESMRDLGELLNVIILAEGVSSDRDYQVLRKIGINAASR